GGGERGATRRSGVGIIKREMIDVIRNGFGNVPPLFPDMKVTTPQVAEQIRAEYESLHSLPAETSPEEREAHYRERVLGSPSLKRLKRAMDEWCAVWFWPTDEASQAMVPTPLTFHQPSGARDAVVDAVAADLKFFHWEPEFPDVFTPQRSGFDSLIGNPPWDVNEASSQEFFTEF